MPKILTMRNQYKKSDNQTNNKKVLKPKKENSLRGKEASEKKYTKSEDTKPHAKNLDKGSKFNNTSASKTTRSDNKRRFEDKPIRKSRLNSDSKDFSYEKPKYDKSNKPNVKLVKKSASSEQEGIRLNKYISNAGICSRREADTLISAGLVTVNGKIVTELGIRVMPGDDVKFGGEKVNPEKKIYILLNKPKDYVTTLDDPQGRKTVMDLIKGACAERVYPVGRLDRNTTGLLLLTNDGDLTKKLTHPKHNKKKIYHVVLDSPLKLEHLEQIASGIELEDGLISADKIDYVGGTQNELGIELHSGRNRIVRRIFEHLGYNIKRLDRVYFAGLTKLNLPRGKWRFLSEKEIIRLKTGMYE